jgi:tetratricopeptide (TPR) repeat protein
MRGRERDILFGMNSVRQWAIPALLLAICLAAISGVRDQARAQGSYIPSPPEQDSILYPEQKKDPRVAPHDAYNNFNKDPYTPKNERSGFNSQDYFAIPVNPIAAQLIPIVENGHLGPKNNPRGFWPRYNEGNKAQAFGELKYVLWVFPNHPRALHLLGMLARETKQPAVPIAFYEKALRLFPDRAYTRAQYGAYLVDSGEKMQGILQLEQALKMDPTMLTARAWLDKARRSIGMDAGANAPASGSAERPMQQDGIYVPGR